jgi:hypothetical protein
MEESGHLHSGPFTPTENPLERKGCVGHANGLRIVMKAKILHLTRLKTSVAQSQHPLLVTH